MQINNTFTAFTNLGKCPLLHTPKKNKKYTVYKLTLAEVL